MRSLILLLLLLTASLTTIGQDEVSEKPEIVLPDTVMKEVFERIVRYKFKIPSTEKTILVSAGSVNPEWLPVITNIKFQLISPNEVGDFEGKTFLFDDIEREGNAYLVYVGWGESDCSATGEIWKFRILSSRVQLWPTGRQWGRGCGSLGNTPPKIPGLKVGDVSPNELPSYQFFKIGKLKDLRLGRSTREDVKRIFNSDCESICDYDSNWNLKIDYFGEDLEFYQTTTSSDGRKINIEFIPKPEFRDRINSISLSPKRPVSFAATKFSRVFAANQSFSIGDCFDQNGFCGAVHTTIDEYKDGYGLTYSVYNEETFNNLRSEKRPSDNNPKKGELLNITYEIPDILNDSIYDKR